MTQAPDNRSLLQNAVECPAGETAGFHAKDRFCPSRRGATDVAVGDIQQGPGRVGCDRRRVCRSGIAPIVTQPVRRLFVDLVGSEATTQKHDRKVSSRMQPVLVIRVMLRSSPEVMLKLPGWQAAAMASRLLRSR